MMLHRRAAMIAARSLAAAAWLVVPLAASTPLFAQAAPSPYTSGTRYDAMGRVTGTISADPDGVGSGNPFLAVRNSYDGAGRLIRVETGTLGSWQSEAAAPAAWSGFSVMRTLETSYDAVGRKSREQLREGAAGAVRSLTQYGYDALGRLECTAVRMNPAAFGSLPASACTLGTPGSDGPDRISRNVYDAAGQRLQVREAVGTADEGAEATWVYDLDGRIVTIIDGNGNRAELRYDGHGRQDRWTFPSAARPGAYDDATQASALATAGAVNAADYEEYGYDPAGNRTSLRKRDGSTLTYQYDALNRLTIKTVPERPTGPQALTAAQTRDVYYGYDLRNLQLYARFDSPSGEGVASAWDGFGRPLSSSTDISGTARTLAYQYDRDGNRIRITHPDGTWFGYAYDGLDRPTYLSTATSWAVNQSYMDHGLPGVTSRVNGTATGPFYDGVQRLWALGAYPVTAPFGVAFQFGRNAAGQITSVNRDNNAYAWTGHYAVNRAYTANGLNQYTGAGPTSFAYDRNGNLTADGGNAYVYDVENRLVSIAGAHNATLAYDPLGRLAAVTAGAGTTRFLYDGDALVAEYNDGGVVQHRYAHWVGADVPMIWYEGSGLDNPRHLIADERGSIVAVTGPNASNIAINSYDEYGIPAAGNLGRFQYTGQIWLAELGLYHYKARLYSPILGRFLQTDPVGYHDQFNLYAYVANEPIDRTDPDGRAALALNICASPAAPLCAGAAPIVGAIAALEGLVLHIVAPPPDPANPPTLAGDIPASDRSVSRDHNGGPTEPRGPVAAPVPHAQDRRDQARAGDVHRQVGDPNRVIHEGRAFVDNHTGNTVYISSGRAVVVNPQGQQVTQFRITAQNVQQRIRDERWRPR